MGKVIKVGIAGFGMSGQLFQAPYLDYDKKFEIKKVYERTKSIAKQQYPYIETVRNFEELLKEDIDLVVISTPNTEHFDMALEAINAGKNVVVEKPFVANADQADKLVSAAKAKGVMLSVYQNRRFDGDFLSTKKIIESGILGEIVDYEVHYDRYVEGYNTRQWKVKGGDGIGSIYDLGTHIIDQAYSIFGMPDELYADMRRLRPESGTDDSFELTMYYPRGKKVKLSASELVLKQGPHYVVHGTHGSWIKYGMDTQEDALKSGIRPGSENFGIDVKENYGVCTVIDKGQIISKTVATEAGFYGKYYDNIYDCIVNGAELLVKPEQSRDVMYIIDNAIKSNKEGRRITLI